MKRSLISFIFFGISVFCSAQSNWPVLKQYDRHSLSKIAMPIGGIGTGTVSLAGNGELKDWELMNRPGKGFRGTFKSNAGNGVPMFAIYVKEMGKQAIVKGLMGPVDLSEYEAPEGSSASNHGIPRFRNATFEAAYPFARVNLSDDSIPVDVSLFAFNPLIPCDADASGIPIAVFRYVVKNKSEKDINVSVCGLMNNFIGCDGSKLEMDNFRKEYIPVGCKGNRNLFINDNGLSGLFMVSDSVSKISDAWGTMALTVKNSQGNVSYKTCLNDIGWNTGFMDFWNDFSIDGILTDDSKIRNDSPQGALSVSSVIGKGETRTFEFYLTWHFPNRYPWEQDNKGIIGNYYTTMYKDAWDVARKTVPVIPELEKRSLAFVKAFCNSSLPPAIKEAALFNLANLRSQTCFRTPDGNFYGWEGCFNHHGSCFGSCTHVWNYETVTPFLFGDLAKRMRNVEFNHATNEKGLMSFRVDLPLKDAQSFHIAAADGQMGCIMKIYREWQLSGDDVMLKNLWPKVKQAMSFAWIEKGWDENNDGVMEGCQHNTMDVEYFGPNPQMQFWYLGALKAANAMAEYLNDTIFEEKCKTLFNNGSRWTDENLFNGEYYIQLIQPLDNSRIAKGLMEGMGSSDFSNPDFQLGNGCLVDQLVGQYMAHICGLGYLADKANIKTTLKNIYRYNHVPDFSEHFNNMRSYVLGGEAGLVMATFPKDRPVHPFPYFSEVMTGFEYTAAAGMIYEGLTDIGIGSINDVRNRFEGTKRNPFNETECGYHYVRAMAAWSSVIAYPGFNYSAVTRTLSIDPKNGVWFWSNGYAFGTIEMNERETFTMVKIKVIEGNLAVKNLLLNSYGRFDDPNVSLINSGSEKTYQVIKL